MASYYKQKKRRWATVKEVTLNLDLAYRCKDGEMKAVAVSIGVKDGEEIKRDISDFLIKTAVNNHAKFAQAMPRTESRMWGKISDLLDERATELTLTGDQFQWLKDVVDKFDYRPGLSSWRWVLLAEFERAAKDAEEKAAAEEKAKE